MTFLLGIFGWLKSTLGKWIIVGGVAAGLYITHEVQLRRLHEQIADLRLQLAEEKAATIDLKIAVGGQNRAIAGVQDQAKRAQKDADARAKHELDRGHNTSNDLRDPNNPIQVGYAAMNEWLRQEFD